MPPDRPLRGGHRHHRCTRAAVGVAAGWLRLRRPARTHGGPPHLGGCSNLRSRKGPANPHRRFHGGGRERRLRSHGRPEHHGLPDRHRHGPGDRMPGHRPSPVDQHATIGAVEVASILTFAHAACALPGSMRQREPRESHLRRLTSGLACAPPRVEGGDLLGPARQHGPSAAAGPHDGAAAVSEVVARPVPPQALTGVLDPVRLRLGPGTGRRPTSSPSARIPDPSATPSASRPRRRRDRTGRDRRADRRELVHRPRCAPSPPRPRSGAWPLLRAPGALPPQPLSPMWTSSRSAASALRSNRARRFGMPAPTSSATPRASSAGWKSDAPPLRSARPGLGRRRFSAPIRRSRFRRLIRARSAARLRQRCHIRGKARGQAVSGQCPSALTCLQRSFMQCRKAF